MIGASPFGVLPLEDRLSFWIRMGGVGFLLLGALLVVPHFAALAVGLIGLMGARALRLSGPERLLPLVAAGVSLVGLAAAALRWETFDLDAVSGAQGVLGPALLVGPEEAAAATALGSAAAVVGLAVGLRLHLTKDWRRSAVVALELIAAGLAVASLSWAPAGAGGQKWLVAVVIGVVAATMSWASTRSPRIIWLALLGLGALCAVVASLMTRMTA